MDFEVSQDALHQFKKMARLDFYQFIEFMISAWHQAVFMKSSWCGFVICFCFVFFIGSALSY